MSPNEQKYTEDDFFRLIGKISVSFSVLDYFTSDFMRDLTKHPSSQALPFLATDTLGRKFSILKKMKSEDASNPDVLAECKSLLPKAFSIADERNRYIHDQWIFDRDLTPSGKIRRIKMTFQGVEDGNTEVSIEDLNQFLDKVVALQDQVIKIHKKLRPQS